MPADPTLVRLVAEAERAAAALRRYIEGGSAEPEPADEFVPLAEAVRIFGCHEVTLRKDVTEKGMGKKEGGRNGKILVNVTMVKQYRPVRGA